MQVIFVSNGEDTIVLVPETQKEKKNAANLTPGTYTVEIISKQTMILDKGVTDGILIKQVKKNED